jgi:hypothetical protein
MDNVQNFDSSSSFEIIKQQVILDRNINFFPLIRHALHTEKSTEISLLLRTYSLPWKRAYRGDTSTDIDKVDLISLLQFFKILKVD